MSVININKKQLKDTWTADCTGHLLAKTTCHTLLLGLKITKSAKYIFQVQVIFVWARYKSRYIYINTIYIIKTSTVVHNAGRQSYLYYPQMWGYHPSMGALSPFIVASLRINQIYIKIDKVKIKPYLHQNHSIG